MDEGKRRGVLANASLTPGPVLHFLTLAEGCIHPLREGFVHDRSIGEIGRGAHVFAAAREAFVHWRQFDLGWIAVVDPTVAIAKDQVVGVEAHTAGLWSINVCRIRETVDTEARFGFLYATTAVHVEEGEERFVIDFEPKTEIVTYCIEAVSRPRHPLAKVAYPFARAMQRRFVRDSLARMRHPNDRPEILPASSKPTENFNETPGPK